MKPTRCPTCHRPHKRSNQANALYWLLLHQVADAIRPADVAYSAEQWHTYFKSRFLGCDEVALPNRKVLQIPRSSAALDVAEFADYLAKVEAWCAERDVYLADREAA